MEHHNCSHAQTSWARAKCRQENGVVRQSSPGRYDHFADGEIYELTAEEIRETHGRTVAQFESCLRSYATNHTLKCSAVKTGGGLRFCLWDEAAESEVSDYLPADVAARERAEKRVFKSSHVGCTHPSTGNERAKCRERRKKKAASW